MVVIQLVWINNAVQLQLDNFNKSVNIALTQISNTLSLNEELGVYLKVARNYLPEEETLLADSASISKRNASDNDLQRIKRYLALSDKSEYLDFYSNEILTHYQQITERKMRIPTRERRYFERLVNDTALLKRPDFQSDLRNAFRVQSLLSITDRINPVSLDSLISFSLSEAGVNLKHELSILQSPTDSILKGIPNKASLDNESQFVIRLFPKDQIGTNHYLLIKFEGQRFYLLRNVGLILLISLFTIILLSIGFYYTVNTIYQQRRLAEMKTDFINNMTHELKTPIATITLASEAMLDLSDNPQFKFISRYSNMIMEENNRMKNNVDRILNTALLESRDFKLEVNRLDLHSCIQRVISQLTLRLNGKYCTPELLLEAREHHLMGDETHILNVINNLLDNAIKYSEQPLILEIYTKNTAQGILLTIEDNGIGMSQSEQKRAFEKFYRASTGDLHNVKGFGLGLSYVKSIVDAHKGFITLSSELGKGTKFELYFPFDHQRS